ncbi:hypothetical protein LZ31DRAFT_559097 [Colletotrichum somersetense]|nr:hypothetical protein LZ31DRAFT_559097 [Colletotrichum somersetense]
MAFPLAIRTPKRQSRTILYTFSTLLLFVVTIFVIMVVPRSPSSVPTKGALRRKLGYETIQTGKGKELKKRTDEFRDSFTSRRGLNGRSLADWRSPAHQDALREMAGAFLEHGDNGRFLWPDDGPSAGSDALTYSNNREDIKDLLHQLFWRENHSSQRSPKRLRIKTEDSELRIIPDGSTHERPFVISDSDDERPPSPDLSARPAAAPHFRVLARTPSPRGSVDRAEDGANARSASGTMADEDPYQEDESPGLSTYIDTTQQCRNVWALMSSGNPPAAPIADMHPFTEHPKTNEPTSAPTTSSRRGQKRPAPAVASRASSRKKTARRENFHATQEQVDEALGSPKRPSVAEHAAASTASAAEAEPIGNPLISVRGQMGNIRLTTESSADAAPTDAAAGTANLRNDGELRERETTRSVVRNTQSSLAKGKAKANPLDPPRPHSPAVPSSSSAIRHADEVPGTGRSGGQRRAPEPSPRGEARLDFRYRVTSHYPRHWSVPWQSGKIGSKTLADLENELPLDLDASRARVLRFLVTTPGTSAEHLVSRGREDEFDALKQHFSYWIRNQIAKEADGKSLMVQFEIEALTDDDPLIPKPIEAVGNGGVSDVDW